MVQYTAYIRPTNSPNSTVTTVMRTEYSPWLQINDIKKVKATDMLDVIKVLFPELNVSYTPLTPPDSDANPE